MRKIIFLSLALILSATACRRRSMPVSPNLDVEHFKAFNYTKTAILLDVRSQEEFWAGHIPDATNIDVNELESHIANFDRTREIFVYCKSGKRGERAVSIFANHGFRKVYNLDGGFEAWVEAEQDVKITGRAFEEDR